MFLQKPFFNILKKSHLMPQIIIIARLLIALDILEICLA